ncbi:MAG: hypothetical protein AAFR73_08110 [Pseudomonadota bacterium]
MLFDLKSDPMELRDLGRFPDHTKIRATMYRHLHDWSLRMSQRVTLSDADIAAKRSAGGQTGVSLGLFCEEDAPAELTAKYWGKVPPRKPPRT